MVQIVSERTTLQLSLEGKCEEKFRKLKNSWLLHNGTKQLRKVYVISTVQWNNKGLVALLLQFTTKLFQLTIMNIKGYAHHMHTKLLRDQSWWIYIYRGLEYVTLITLHSNLRHLLTIGTLKGCSCITHFAYFRETSEPS